MFDAIDALELPAEAHKRDMVCLVLKELERAQLRFGPYRSPHEGYAVILEELDELWVEVKHNKRPTDEHKAALRAEAKQVACVALRFLVDLT